MQAREERRAQLERENTGYESSVSSQIDNDLRLHISNDENQEKRQTPSSLSVSPEVTLKTPDVTELDGQQDGQAHPVHHSLSNIIALTAAYDSIELLEPTTGAATEQLEASHLRERPDLPDEYAGIPEILSPLENTIDGLRIPQCKEDAAE